MEVEVRVIQPPEAGRDKEVSSPRAFGGSVVLLTP